MLDDSLNFEKSGDSEELGFSLSAAGEDFKRYYHKISGVENTIVPRPLTFKISPSLSPILKPHELNQSLAQDFLFATSHVELPSQLVPLENEDTSESEVSTPRKSFSMSRSRLDMSPTRASPQKSILNQPSKQIGKEDSLNISTSPSKKTPTKHKPTKKDSLDFTLSLESPNKENMNCSNRRSPLMSKHVNEISDILMESHSSIKPGRSTLMEIKDVSDDSLRFSLDSQPTRKKVSGELIIQAADSLEFSDLNESISEPIKSIDPLSSLWSQSGEPPADAEKSPLLMQASIQAVNVSPTRMGKLDMQFDTPDEITRNFQIDTPGTDDVNIEATPFSKKVQQLLIRKGSVKRALSKSAEIDMEVKNPVEKEEPKSPALTSTILEEFKSVEPLKNPVETSSPVVVSSNDVSKFQSPGFERLRNQKYSDILLQYLQKSPLEASRYMHKSPAMKKMLLGEKKNSTVPKKKRKKPVIVENHSVRPEFKDMTLQQAFEKRQNSQVKVPNTAKRKRKSSRPARSRAPPPRPVREICIIAPKREEETFRNLKESDDIPWMHEDYTLRISEFLTISPWKPPRLYRDRLVVQDISGLNYHAEVDIVKSLLSNAVSDLSDVHRILKLYKYPWAFKLFHAFDLDEVAFLKIDESNTKKLFSLAKTDFLRHPTLEITLNLPDSAHEALICIVNQPKIQISSKGRMVIAREHCVPVYLTEFLR